MRELSVIPVVCRPVCVQADALNHGPGEWPASCNEEPTPPRFASNPKPAFTLLELLIVITIIVVLLALLVPAMDNAIGLAEEAKCKVNLKNTYKGFVEFSLDHKTNLPGAFITFWDSRGSWVGTEAGYQGKQVGGGSELHPIYDEAGNAYGSSISPGTTRAGNSSEWAAHADQPQPQGTIVPYVGLGAASRGLYRCPSLSEGEKTVEHTLEDNNPDSSNTSYTKLANSNFSNGGYDYAVPSAFSGSRFNSWEPNTWATVEGERVHLPLPLIIEKHPYVTFPSFNHDRWALNHRDLGTMYVAMDGSLYLYHHRSEATDFGVHGPSATHRGTGQRVPLNGFIYHYGRWR